MANVLHMLVNGNEPFIFPSQVQQVFHSNDSSNPWWKVILHKESCNKHVFLDAYGECISTNSTNEYGSVLDAQGAMPNAPTTLSNVGAIFLSRKESLLLDESKQLSFEKQSQRRNSRR
jgi:hypothetical protein